MFAKCPECGTALQDRDFEAVNCAEADQEPGLAAELRSDGQGWAIMDLQIVCPRCPWWITIPNLMILVTVKIPSQETSTSAA